MVRTYIKSAVAGVFLVGSATAALVARRIRRPVHVGLAMSKDLPTDCSVNEQLQCNCFSSTSALTQFMADPSGNLAKAQTYYSSKHPG